MSPDLAALIRAETQITRPPLVPEIQLHLATALTPLWHRTEAALDGARIPAPFWAFAWAGGQGLARYALDHPDRVRGRTVLDFACGGGVAGLAAARAGATRVLATDLNPAAGIALQLNAELNGVTLAFAAIDLTEQPCQERPDLILAGDVIYERAMGARIQAWLRRQAREGAVVWIGEAGRGMLDTQGLAPLARYRVDTPPDLEDRPSREVMVYEISGA